MVLFDLVSEESKDIEMPSEPELKNLEDEAKKLIQDARGQLKQEEEGAKKDEEMAARIAKLKGIPEGATSASECFLFVLVEIAVFLFVL